MPYRGSKTKYKQKPKAKSPKLSGYSAFRRAQSKTATTDVAQPKTNQFMYGTLGNYVQPPNPYMAGTIGNYGPQPTRITTGPFAQQPGYFYNLANPNAMTQMAQPQIATQAHNTARSGYNFYGNRLGTKGTVRQHGYHQYVMNKIYGQQGIVEPAVEAAGTTVPIGPPYPSGDYGYGGYDYGYGGGGSNWVAPPNYWNKFQPGGAIRGVAPPAPLGVRAAPVAAPYRAYATQNEGQRWMQLLTQWNIGR